MGVCKETRGISTPPNSTFNYHKVKNLHNKETISFQPGMHACKLLSELNERKMLIKIRSCADMSKHDNFQILSWF